MSCHVLWEPRRAALTRALTCEPAEGYLGQHGAASGGVEPELAHVRQHHGGVDAVNADVMLAELQRHHPGGRVDRGLGGPVGGVALQRCL